MPKPTDVERSNLPQITLVSVVVVGLVLMFGGFTWKRIVPFRVLWGESQAVEFEQAKVDFHQLSLQLEPDSAEDDPALESARQRVAQAEQDLAAARFARNDIGRYLAMLGSLLVGGGALGLYVRRQGGS